MSASVPPVSAYPWEQQSLFPPDAVSLELLLHFERSASTIQLGLTWREYPTGEMFGCEILHVANTDQGVRDAVGRIASELVRARAVLTLFD